MHFIYLNYVRNDEINTKTPKALERYRRGHLVGIHVGLKLSGFSSLLHKLGLKLR